MIPATDIRVGNLILYNGKPYRVAQMVHRTPGNLRGFVQAKLVNIENGTNQEVRFSSEEKVEKAQLDEHSFQFSYRAGDAFHFMNTDSYEMIELSRDVLGEAAGYLTDGMVINASYWQGKVVGIEPPMFVELEVRETTPNIKGAAVQNTSKPAVLETGLEIKVPPYIEQGNRVKVDTRTGQFVERV
ncbi:MAG TPA: elongation factor P [Candidatus Acidoferrales bacterium]|nr:elongation factor P [Candidatus Acidoferrales bacterium]